MASSLVFNYSTASGSSGYTTGSDRTQSHGKYTSVTKINTNSGQNLFSNVTSGANYNMTPYYKCIFLSYDGAGSFASANSIQITVSGATGGVDFYLGLDPFGPKPKGQTGAQSVQIANETTAPTGVTFSQPSGTGYLNITTIPDQNVHGLWVKMLPQNTPAVTGDTGTISISYTESVA